MRNLKVTNITYLNFKEYISTAQCMTVDWTRGFVYVANGKEVYGFNPYTKEVLSTVHISDYDDILSINFLIDQELVCIVTNSGEIYTWNPENAELESVGCVSSGVTCMSWSPDFELMAITTGDNKFIIMTSEFDPVFEGNIHSNEFGEATSVNVGWGKKETQFHGSAGKPTQQDLKAPEAGPVYDWDDRQTRITWHGDASYFAINSIEPETGIRKIRVWNRDGTLFSTNEVLDGLEQALCWRPSGRVIASTQRKQNKHDVIFFEKNGLRHGNFTLPFGINDVKVLEMAWNSNSDILAILIEDLHLDNQSDVKRVTNSKPFVQIWTTGNYHWYLKQELLFGEEIDGGVADMHWDQDNPGRLHILCKNGTYYSYTWITSVFHSVGNVGNISTVAVIDGKKALLTPFKLLVTPPPMSAQELIFQAPINHLCFGPEELSSSFAAVLSNGNLLTAMALHPEVENRMPAYKVNNFGRVIGCEDHPQWLRIQELFWLQKDLVILAVHEKGSNCRISAVLLELHEDDAGLSSFLVKSTTSLLSSIISIARTPNPNMALFHSNDGSVMQYNCEDFTRTPYQTKNALNLTMPSSIPELKVVKVDHDVLVFGLTRHYRLYVDGAEIMNDCTSYAIHKEFLVVTTLGHKCRCISLNSLKKYRDNLQNSEELEEGVRAIERGSKIVIAVMNDSKVVLQMPRGNLETIHPRALVISSLKKILSSLHYKQAITTMKRHRINLNLICDHNLELFLENIDSFIKQVEMPNDINLFLADLNAADVTSTLYKPYYSEEYRKTTSYRFRKKDVDVICERAREALKQIDPKKYVLCILTTYVMQRNKDLESALLLIREIRDSKNVKLEHGDVSWEKALKYMLYLVDVNEIYDVALGLYDFDLVLLVAEKSQKDPKEYLPYLNNLKKMDSNVMKYNIDVDLKRYKKALNHIAKAGKEYFEKCLELAKEHNLYKEALELFDKASLEFKKISLAYGQSLRESKKFVEAGLVFSRSQEYEDALDSYSRALHWTLAISSAYKLKMSAVEISSLCRKLAVDLKAKEKYLEASYLFEVYCKDPEESILALIEGHRWAEALAQIERFQRHDITETNLRPSLLEEYKNTITLVEEKRAEFLQYKDRLQVVREEKRKKEEQRLGNENFQDDPENELFSDVSSITGQSALSTTSGSSRSSGHSSKSRRKSQRKKYSLKEGSQYEDFALMEALAEIVNTCDRMQDEIGSTIQTLVLLEYEDEGEELQKNFQMLFDLLASQIEPIWKPKTDIDKNPGFGPGASTNAIVASMSNPVSSLSFLSNPDLPEPTRAILRKDIKWKLSTF